MKECMILKKNLLIFVLSQFVSSLFSSDWFVCLPLNIVTTNGIYTLIRDYGVKQDSEFENSKYHFGVYQRQGTNHICEVSAEPLNGSHVLKFKGQSQLDRIVMIGSNQIPRQVDLTIFNTSRVSK